jgi:hypothetical protein
MIPRPLLLTAAAVGLSISCASENGTTRPASPAAEFLVVSGDSTFWVRSDTAGLRVRGSSLLLARLDGGFHEIYVVDDDRSFHDATFVAQRIYRRDIHRGDSVAVFDDATVPRLARAYAVSHPQARPLGPEEEGSDSPTSVATTEVHVLGIHGPYLSYEYRADLDVAGGTDSHLLRTGVIDLRSGAPASLARIFGERAGAALLAAGREAARRMADSVRRSADPRAMLAAAALHAFEFDSSSFALESHGGEPVVMFTVPGRGGAAGGLAIPLPPLAAPRTSWWNDQVRDGTPGPVDADGVVRWRRAGYELVARTDSVEGVVALTLRDARRRSFRLPRMSGPLRHIYWLDRPSLGATQRAALERAFDEAAFYGEEVRTVSRPSSAIVLPVQLRSGLRPAPQVRQ